MTAYYNEFDPAAAHILKAMIDFGVIAPGEVDTRSIKEVQPDDLIGFTQCHFFAGGGLWSVAARLAGWPDYEPLWTGSCPCQPFSAAGKGAGTDDPRHLWPDFHRLISARRPPVVMGEQVAGAAGYGWFDGVRSDLAGEGFASRTVDFPACSVDAPHQRNRLYWVAMEEPNSRRQEGRSVLGPGQGDSADQWNAHGQPRGPNGCSGQGVTLGDAFGKGLEGQRRHGDGSWRQKPGGSVAEADGAERYDVANGAGKGRNAGTFAGVRGEAQGQRARHVEPERSSGFDCDGLYADADSSGRAGWQEGEERGSLVGTSFERDLLRNGTYWSDAEWIVCHDGKARRTKPGIRFLVDGLPGRVDLWRVGGNAIVPEAAKEVIAAFIDAYGLPSSWRIAA